MFVVRDKTKGHSAIYQSVGNKASLLVVSVSTLGVYLPFWNYEISWLCDFVRYLFVLRRQI